MQSASNESFCIKRRFNAKLFFAPPQTVAMRFDVFGQRRSGRWVKTARSGGESCKKISANNGAKANSIRPGSDQKSWNILRQSLPKLSYTHQAARHLRTWLSCL